MFQNKYITVGLTACSPAYKAVELIEYLKKNGAEVQVIMTPNSRHFVSPMMLQRVSQNRVLEDAFEIPAVFDKNYRSPSERSDLLLIAPASANTIGKIANGIADNLLTTTALSVDCPIVMAMNFNPKMYQKKSVRRNIELLKEDGVVFVENGNEKFPSRYPALENIIETLERILK